MSTNRHAQITRTHTVYGSEQATHVRVEVFEVVGSGIRRRLDSLDLAIGKVRDDAEAIRKETEAKLREAGLLDADDRVLTEPEAREAMLQGANP